MKNVWYVLLSITIFTLPITFLVLPGCSKSGTESDSKSTEIYKLSAQIVPLQIRRYGGVIETITLSHAMDWHHHREHKQHNKSHSKTFPELSDTTAKEEPHGSDSRHPLCLGVLTGYQAIRYAVDGLFGREIPDVNDFDIRVNGPMEGVWDVINLYTGRKLNFDGKLQKMDLQSFTFTAKRESTDQLITFRIRPGLIPKEFFELKNQGATCSDDDLKKVKQKALLSILSIEPNDCFQIVGSSIIEPGQQ